MQRLDAKFRKDLLICGETRVYGSLAGGRKPPWPSPGPERQTSSSPCGHPPGVAVDRIDSSRGDRTYVVGGKRSHDNVSFRTPGPWIRSRAGAGRRLGAASSQRGSTLVDAAGSASRHRCDPALCRERRRDLPAEPCARRRRHSRGRRHGGEPDLYRRAVSPRRGRGPGRGGPRLASEPRPTPRAAPRRLGLDLRGAGPRDRRARRALRTVLHGAEDPIPRLFCFFPRLRGAMLGIVLSGTSFSS